MKNENKEFYLRGLFDYYRINKFISVLAMTAGTDLEKTFEYNGKTYTIKKNDSNIDLLCDDGRDLLIYGSTCRDLIPQIGESASKITFIRANYRINNSHLVYSKSIENVDLLDLVSPDSISYGLTEEYCNFQTSGSGFLDLLTHFSKNCAGGYDIVENGYKYKDCLISKDCQKVVSKNGVSLPSKETFMNFTYEKERKEWSKLLKTINDSKLDSHIKKEIIKNSKAIDLIEDFEEVKELYRRLPSLEEAVKFHKALYDGSINNYTYSSEELDLFISELTNELQDTIIEFNDKILLDNAKKMVKSLSNKGLSKLEKMINSKKERQG